MAEPSISRATQFSGIFSRFTAAAPATLSDLGDYGAPSNLADYRPKALNGDAGWERVLSVLAANKATLDIKDADPISEGGMGWVLKVHQESLDRIVAMKVGKFPASDDLGERFRAEAAKTANLNHPSIPKVHDFGILTQGDLPYYVMEFVDGQTLEAWLPGLHAGGEAIDWRAGQGAKALKHIKDAATALEYAHSQGVVHRDIKPENLMVTPSGLVVVLDWGLFKHEGASEAAFKAAARQTQTAIFTRVGSVVGTTEYMSPEQASGIGVSKLADVWALGATLYRVVCNKLPLEHHGDRDSQDAALRSGKLTDAELIKRPSEMASAVPAELEAIIMKALKQNPQERYQSADELAADLARFQERRPVDALLEQQSPLANMTYSTTSFARRHRTGLGVAVLTLAALGGGIKVATQIQEADRAAAVRETEKTNLIDTAKASLESAREHSQAGRLREAILSLPKQLIDDLENYPQLSELRNDIIHHRTDWQTLLDFKQKIFDVYSGTVNTFELGKIAPIDVAKLGEAVKDFLPDGLTEESVKALRQRLDSSVYTPEERAQIGDGLMEWAVMDMGEKFPLIYKVRKISDEAKAVCPAALEHISLVERMGAACDAVDGKSEQRIPVVEHLRTTVHAIAGDAAAVARSRELRGQFDVSASAAFLQGLLAQYEKGNEPLSISVRLEYFPRAVAIDPTHLGAGVFLAQTLYRHYEMSSSEMERRTRMTRVIDAFQHCCNLEPNNPYHWGRLALVCQTALYEETHLVVGSRINVSAPSIGRSAALRAIALCQSKAIEVPPQLHLALGDLAFQCLDFKQAAQSYESYLHTQPEDVIVSVRFACARLSSGGIVKLEEVLPLLEQAEKLPSLHPQRRIEMAAIYSHLLETGQTSESFSSMQLSELALNSLKIAAAYNADMLVAIKGRGARWFKALQNNEGYQSLVNPK